MCTEFYFETLQNICIATESTTEKNAKNVKKMG